MKTVQKRWMLTGIGAAVLTVASIGGIVAASVPASATITSPTSVVEHQTVEDGTPDGETVDDQGTSNADGETADDQNEQDSETADDGSVGPLG